MSHLSLSISVSMTNPHPPRNGVYIAARGDVVGTVGYTKLENNSGYYYDFNEVGVIITGKLNSIIIPEKIDDFVVVEIEAFAFCGRFHRFCEFP